MKRIAQAGAITFRFADDAPLELKEEAGVRARPVKLIGSLDFQSGDEMVHVSYYLFQYLSDVPREEEREIRWCAYDDALTLLSHGDAARLLKKALPDINSHIAGLRSSQKRTLDS